MKGNKIQTVESRKSVQSYVNKLKAGKLEENDVEKMDSKVLLIFTHFCVLLLNYSELLKGGKEGEN
jgi:hypothetical protein